MLLSWYDEHQRTLPWRHGTTNGGYVWVTYEIKSTPTCKLLFEAIMDTCVAHQNASRFLIRCVVTDVFCGTEAEAILPKLLETTVMMRVPTRCGCPK